MQQYWESLRMMDFTATFLYRIKLYFLLCFVPVWLLLPALQLCCAKRVLFASVCVYVCLTRNWCNLGRNICYGWTVEEIRFWLHLTLIFDLESWFSISTWHPLWMYLPYSKCSEDECVSVRHAMSEWSCRPHSESSHEVSGWSISVRHAVSGWSSMHAANVSSLES